MALALKRIEPSPSQGSAAAPLPVARPLLPTAVALLPYLDRIDGARWYSNWGPLATELEARLAERLGGAEVSTASSGTQALILALKAMDIAPGSLCAMPSWTFVATAHAAIQAGLVPWFLDVDPVSWMLEPQTVRAALASAPGPVGAILPVAAFGARPDMEGWTALRAETGIPVLIDAAAAFDTLADAALPACLSLHATKLIGAGEGGVFACDDPVLMDRFRRLSSFGFRGSRESTLPASNAKLSEYGAAVALASLDAWPQARRRWLLAAQHLRIALADRPEVSFQPGWGVHWVGGSCVVGLPDGAADQVEAVLNGEGIGTRRWWGEGCHRSPAFVSAPQGDLSVTERLAGSTLGLPFAVDMEQADIERIAQAVRRALGG